jgi:site-specific recombinase XerC
MARNYSAGREDDRPAFPAVEVEFDILLKSTLKNDILISPRSGRLKGRYVTLSGMNQLVPKSASRTVAAATGAALVPDVIADDGEHAARRFLEFFAATIRNKNTRLAYYRAACHFFAWVERHEIGGLADIEPVHVAAYIEVLQDVAAKPTVKQYLAAIRMLFDWLVVGQVLAVNPAHAVRGPKHVVRRGKTPVLTEEEARRLLGSIDVSTLVGMRDRALIGVMTYAFARIGAVVGMKVEDYYPAGKRWWVRLHEKGGKRHEMPAHHKLEASIDEYLAAAGIREDGKGPLFRTARGKTIQVRVLKDHEHRLPTRQAFELADQCLQRSFLLPLRA